MHFDSKGALSNYLKVIKSFSLDSALSLKYIKARTIKMIENSNSDYNKLSKR